MLSVTDAVSTATSHLTKFFPSAQKLRLEEVELTDDDQFWLITLSFVDPNQEPTVFQALSRIHGEGRFYKVVKINKESGEVRSIKIRELQNA